jgi:hypothetical protein
MVKVTSMVVESTENGVREVIASLAADTKAEVDACGSSGANIKGLTANDIMTLGSTAFCADGNFGRLRSDGIWNW